MAPMIPTAQPAASITFDQTLRTASLSDPSHQLTLRLNWTKGCVVDRMQLKGRQLIDEQRGIWSGIQVAGQWFTTATLDQPPKIATTSNGLSVSGIEYGGGGMRVQERWTFSIKQNAIDWKIDRQYQQAGTIDAVAMPLVSFLKMATWTGAVLGSGGVAWCKLLDSPNATYGVQTQSATFWNQELDPALSLSCVRKTGGVAAMRFTREQDGGFSIASCLTRQKLLPKDHQARFLKNRQDIWAPFSVAKSETVSATYEFKPLSYRQVDDRGNFVGLDTRAITEMVNTIGRIGVIDEGLVGTNGWYSGYICLHEPWQARDGTAIDDPNYMRSEAEFLDDARDHAVQPDGMVKSRWYYYSGDAQPGTYDEKTGFYEAQWGRLMDSQSSYVWNVSDQFDQSGDKAWVASHKASCEAALEYLLRRDANHNGLVEMQNKSIKEKRSSDWLDIVWASNENAFVNAQLYGALLRWASVERLLGDETRAIHYRDFAAKLKKSFNKTIDQGGFWDPSKGWYAYWRDADGSIHGNNLTLEVNLTALADGICDEPGRRRILLDGIEARMKRESLLSWPACFESFAAGEGADDHFPTYENGDIFLSWAEYGVKAYATSDPQTALKYVKQLLAQYKIDGLAFQRYLRASGKGAGDDILAGNCNIITGLYRDIYGINPKYNRMLLDPHLAPELDGTEVNYDFRGKKLKISLSQGNYAIEEGGKIVKSPTAFGLDFEPDQLTYFEGDNDDPAMTIHLPKNAGATLNMANWNRLKRLTITTNNSGLIGFKIFGIQPGMSYRVVSAGRTLGSVSRGQDTVRLRCKAGRPAELELIEQRT
jgi:hypothetical protein